LAKAAASSLIGAGVSNVHGAIGRRGPVAAQVERVGGGRFGTPPAPDGVPPP
jgi:hypothetical protein